MSKDKKNSQKNVDTPFIRFRHGTRLEIKPHVRESIKKFLKRYKQQGEQTFSEYTLEVS